MKNEDKIKVGISIGDLNGIGPEIILKTFEDSRMYDFCTPVVFASYKLMGFYKKQFQSKVNLFDCKDISAVSEGKMNVITVWKDHVDVNFGQEDPKAGEFAISSLQAAVKSLQNNTTDLLVTAPIHKHNSQSQEFKFPGHTDYLAKELGGDSLMFMVSDSLRIGLLTDHVPVKDVPSHIDEALIIKKIGIVSKSLKEDFKIRRPKIAVLSINPHAGDQGVIGNEDDEIVVPVLKKLREEGELVYGPFAADSFFGSQNHKNFDAIIASYHDQGLIPFKTITFGEGVNYTAGLSKVRTSPDHGTAFEIAGKGVANEDSFKKAVFVGIEIFKNRKEHHHYSKDPLVSSQK